MNRPQIRPEQFLGFGSKKKKAEKKVRKAEKQMTKGNTKAAERKLVKAARKTSKAKPSEQAALIEKISETRGRLENQIKTNQAAEASGNVAAQVPVLTEPMNPQPLQVYDAPTGTSPIPGGGTVGGGGSDLDYSPQTEIDEAQNEFNQRYADGNTDDADGDPSGTGSNLSLLTLAAIALGIYLLYKFTLKKK